MIFLQKLRAMLRLGQPERAGLRPVIDEASLAWPFADAAIDLSPAAPGVYFLYRDGRLIYIGLAVKGSGIRQELESHRRGAHGAGTRGATAFLYEQAPDARALYRRYLSAHRQHHDGRLPLCNEPEPGPR